MRRRRAGDVPEIQMAPMIDCVFLMLVYFMTTSSLEKSEADLVCPVGQAGLMSDPLAAVDEQRLQINAEGVVLWNGSRFGLLDSDEIRALVNRLSAFRGTCEASGSEPSLRLHPEKDAPHQAIVSLLDSISEAGIETIHFP